MRKFLLTLGAMLTSASALFAALPTGTQITNESLAADMVDGAVIALQCLDTNGGAGYYFNGAAAKSTTLSYNNLYKVCTQEDGTFALQSVSTEQYVGCANTSFTGNALVAMTDDVDAAGKFTASIATASGWTTVWAGVVNGTNTIRLTAQSGAFFNTNDRVSTPKYFTGAGGYSVWYAYKFTPEEVEELKNPDLFAEIDENTPYIVKHLSKGLYLNGQQVDVPDANNASVSVIPSIIYFERNPENQAQFAIRINSAESGKYINHNSWNAIMNDASVYWTLSEAGATATQGGTVVKIARADGGTLGCNSTGSKAYSVYSNVSASADGTNWEIIPLSSVNVKNIANTAYQWMAGPSNLDHKSGIGIPADNEQLAALAEVLNDNASTDQQIIAALNGVTFNYYTARTAKMAPVDGGIYTIQSNELGARGYLCINNGVLNTSLSSGAPTFDASSDNFRFVTVCIDEKTYLYNPATELFVNAFGRDTDSNHGPFQNNVDHVWQVSSVPTPIEFTDYTKANSAPHIVRLMGGLEPANHYSGYNNHPQHGGMTLVGNGSGGSWLAFVTVGITDNADGNGLIVFNVGNMTEEELAAVKAKVAAAHQAVDDEINGISTDENLVIVNAHKSETSGNVAAAETPDHKRYILDTAERHQFTDGYVYTIENAEGQAFFCDTDAEITLKEYDGADKGFHWQALAGEDGTWSFMHHIAEGEAQTRAAVQGGATLDNVAGTADLSELGKVKFGDEAFVITQRGTSADDATTTEIFEISAGNATRAAMFDLSGRRVASPVRGIYVTADGQKIFMK